MAPAPRHAPPSERNLGTLLAVVAPLAEDDITSDDVEVSAVALLAGPPPPELDDGFPSVFPSVFPSHAHTTETTIA